MTAAYRVTVAGLNDISTVSIICECSSAVSLNFGSTRIPQACACCGKQYSESVTAALAAFGRFYREGLAAEAHSGKPVFRFEIRHADA